MMLSREEAELFFKLYNPLLVYANRKLKVVSGMDSMEGIRSLPVGKAAKVREQLYENPEIIDCFVEENPLSFSPDELEIVRSWKNFVKGKFIIFRYLKKYTIFLSLEEPPKAYGVLALTTPLEEMIDADLPVMVEAVLLPFRGKVIYDGLLVPYPVVFGGGIRRGFNEAYQKAKSMLGIITSLPFEAREGELSDVERLKFYLRSNRNRERYWEEIQELINKNPSLLKIYHQEMGKVLARTYRRRLREIGITDGWFAILDGMIIASGQTEEEVNRILRRLLPSEKIDWAYVFRLKSK